MFDVERYELEKAVWTNADFDVMGWSDASMWAMAVISDDFELVFDIDYILHWVHPVPPEQYFRLWISPATLVFHGVQNIMIDMDIEYGQCNQIDDINREGPFASSDGSLKTWKWTIDHAQGDIEFEAQGFTQYFRKAPIYRDSIDLGLEQRGGLSFDRNYIG